MPPPMMIETLGAKNLKSSGRMMIEKSDDSIRGKKSKTSRGGWGGAAAPPMMIEKVMTIRGKKSGGVMIEKVMFQWAKKYVFNKAAARASVPLRQGLMVKVRIQIRAN